jgi:hypothetical protein
MQTINWNYTTKLYYNWYWILYLLEDQDALHCTYDKVFPTSETSATKANADVSKRTLLETG